MAMDVGLGYRAGRECLLKTGDPAIKTLAPAQKRAQRRGQQLEALLAPAQTDFLGAKAVALAGGVAGAHVSVTHGPLHQQPACGLHQPGGDAHALAGIEQGSLARQVTGFAAARAIKIARGFFDQSHAFVEGALEQLRLNEALQRHARGNVVVWSIRRHEPELFLHEGQGRRKDADGPGARLSPLAVRRGDKDTLQRCRRQSWYQNYVRTWLTRLKHCAGGGARGFARDNGLAAAGDLGLQTFDARSQFMFRQGCEVLAEHDFPRLRSGLKFVRIDRHVFALGSGPASFQPEPATRQDLEVKMSQSMRAIAVEAPGKGYRLVLSTVERPQPGPGEVLVQVAAAGINRADIAQALGGYPPPKGASPILGLEVSGHIVALGPQVEGWRIGDEVCALLAGGGYAEFAVVPVPCLLPVPQGVDLVAAAALPEVHFTVWTNLMDSARLDVGQSVLIHGGSSGIGTAAIQLCAARGHRVFATAGSADKCTACVGFGAERAINYRSEDFVAVVKEATEGRGVDVILDMVGGDYIERNFHALALNGRLVNIAFMAGAQANVNFGVMLMKRLSFMATTLRARSSEEKGRIGAALRAQVWPLIAAGKIRPVVDSVLPLSRAMEAHTRMASSAHIGKILLTTAD